jgi:hypothetical protein
LEPGRTLLLCREQRFRFVKERNWKSIDDKETKRPSLVFKCLICLLQLKVHEKFCLTNGHQLTKEKKSQVFSLYQFCGGSFNLIRTYGSDWKKP